MLADTRYRHDHSLVDIPQAMHAAERNDRRQKLKKKFADTIPDIMTGELDPGFTPGDDMVEMYEALRHTKQLHPMDVPTRRQ